MVENTLTKGTPECPLKKALTKCEYKRLKMRYRQFDEMVPRYRCNEDGSFSDIQCFPEVKKCWCVDEHGHERNGTRQTGKPTNCRAWEPVLSPCQSSQLNIKNLKELLSKMAANYSETANNLKSKAENTSLKHVNQSHQQRQRYRRHQLNQERMCRMIARDILNMLRYITEPKCAADGNYESIQCGSSGRRCWCVDVNGKMVGFMKSRDKLNCSAKGRANVCPSMMSYGSGAGTMQRQSIPACRNDSDCSDPKVCCKNNYGGRGCVDPKMPDIKPGKCPVIPKSINYTCPSKCKSDTDCRGDMKCCGMGCGKRCIPVNKQVCPTNKPFKLCIYDKCLSSPGCPSHPSACCRMNYCGECTAEYYDEHDRKIDCSNATQCQKQRHAATETYKRSFLKVFGTLPMSVQEKFRERNGDEADGGNEGGIQGRNQVGGGNQGGRPGSDTEEDIKVEVKVVDLVDLNTGEIEGLKDSGEGQRGGQGGTPGRVNNGEAGERQQRGSGGGQFGQGRGGRQNRGHITSILKDNVVSICKVKKEQIQNVEISRGSIKVKFDIVDEEGDSNSLEEIVEELQKEVHSRNFVVKIEDKEYRSDGEFHASVHIRRYDDTAEPTRQLSRMETIAIGSCATICFLGTAVSIWKFCVREKKKQPEDWKDMAKGKPPEVQCVIPEPGPVFTSSVTVEPPSPEAMLEPSV
ncbi:hypothetical protein OS493_021679 [Desmophyllum pertusum]|uniref:Thyroglobulin type-1 domain-containing protein n=1 Tax=Desmophyllum pertusum TaxID=174260 RepID=A0A9W9YB59_9CNID|nr:hypothetical protein OS493_021679 [Desmophyllum pertusum]